MLNQSTLVNKSLHIEPD